MTDDRREAMGRKSTVKGKSQSPIVPGMPTAKNSKMWCPGPEGPGVPGLHHQSQEQPTPQPCGPQPSHAHLRT